MNMNYSVGIAHLLCVLAAFCALLTLIAGLVCPRAFADERSQEVFVEGVSYNHDAGGAVATKPNDIMWDVAVDFSVNVAVPVEGADDGFIQRNLDRVHLYKADGGEVQGWHASVEGGGKRVIYIELDGWLAPLTEYQVVVDAGLEAAESDGVLTCEYRESFVTGAMCSNGLSVYQNVWIALAVLVVIGGIAIQVWRVRGRKR